MPKNERRERAKKLATEYVDALSNARRDPRAAMDAQEALTADPLELALAIIEMAVQLDVADMTAEQRAEVLARPVTP